MLRSPGKRWRHIVINTHATWLPGDARGFRSRDHRIHSSGDYRNPPPDDEHAGLRAHSASRSGAPFELPRTVLSEVGRAIVAILTEHDHAIAVIAVAPNHVHWLAELPDNVAQIKKIVGWCKYFATRAARACDPTLHEVEIWAHGETYKPVDEESHWHSVVRYVSKEQGADAWVWVAS